MKRTNHQRRVRERNAFSLLELTIAMSMMAVLAMSSMRLLRTSQSAWSRHQSDQVRRNSANAVVRHVVRNLRQAEEALVISDSSNNSGTLTIRNSGGTNSVWAHNPALDTVSFATAGTSNVLANHITQLNFVGYKVDGTTATTEADLIHSVVCTATYHLDRPQGQITESIASRAWIRSW